jgi:hypothetical protein
MVHRAQLRALARPSLFSSLWVFLRSHNQHGTVRMPGALFTHGAEKQTRETATSASPEDEHHRSCGRRNQHGRWLSKLCPTLQVHVRMSCGKRSRFALKNVRNLLIRFFE